MSSKSRIFARAPSSSASPKLGSSLTKSSKLKPHSLRQTSQLHTTTNGSVSKNISRPSSSESSRLGRSPNSSIANGSKLNGITNTTKHGSHPLQEWDREIVVSIYIYT